jgi:hypothetical protein
MALAIGWRAFLILAATLWAFVPANAHATDGEPEAATDADGDAARGFERVRKPLIPVSFLSTDGGWIQFQYPPSGRDRVGALMAEADDLRAELADLLGQAPLDGVEVRIARGPEEMATLAPWMTQAEPSAGGMSYPKLRLIVLSLGASGAESVDLGVAFRRELAHMALDQAVAGHPLPNWLVDGLAAHFARDGNWSRAIRLYRLVVRRRPDNTAELDGMLDPHVEPSKVAVAEAADLVAFLLAAERRSRFAAMVSELRRGEGIDAAVRIGYGSNLALLERKWASDLGRRATLVTVYGFLGVVVAVAGAGVVARVLRRRRLRLAARRAPDARRPAVSSDRARVHIVFSRRDERIEPPVVPEAEIPKVEHEGEWHTLH